MFTLIMLYLFILVGMLNLIHFWFYLAGANIYDIWQFFRHRRLPREKHRERPLVSVLIPAHNEAKSIIRCLESVRTSSYRKYEVIVINDASTDATHKLVARYIKRHPNRKIKLLWKRKNVGKAEALNHALRHVAKGKYVMMLDADSVLHKDAIKNALRYFQNPNVVGVAANVRILDSNTLLGLLQKFEHMIGYRAKKFYSITNSEFIIGGVASTYRRDVVKQVGYYDKDTVTEDIGLSLKVVALGNKQNRIVYGVDVVAFTEGVQTFKALLRQRFRWKMGSLQNLVKYRKLFGKNSPDHSRVLTMYRLPMAILGEILLLTEPFVLIFAAYLTIAYGKPQLFIGAYLAITIYVLLNLWPDEHTTFRRKCYLSLYAPIMYFVFYIMDLIQVVSIIRCLISIKQILRKTASSATWVSPERPGDAPATG